MKYHVVYHRVDLDGQGSAFLVSAFCNYYDHLSPVLGYGCNYNDDLDFVVEKISKSYEAGDKLFVLDFSFNVQNFSKLIELFGHDSVCWYDHHISTKDIEEAIPNIIGIRDYSRAAVEIIYSELISKNKLTQTLDLGVVLFNRLGDYDIHRSVNSDKKFWNGEVLPMQEWMKTSFDNYRFPNLKNSDNLLCESPAYFNWFAVAGMNQDGYNKMKYEGLLMIKAVETLYKRAAFSTAFKAKIWGFTFNVADCGGLRTSQYLSSVSTEGVDAMLLYTTVVRDGVFRTDFSIFANPDTPHNFSEIAKRFGGGGHPSACGFSFEGDPKTFLESVETEYI